MNSVGDLAQTYLMRSQQSFLKKAIQQHAQEVTTGLTHDSAAHLKGDLGAVLSLESSLSRLEAYRFVARDAQLSAQTMQSVLEQAREDTSELAPNFLSSHLTSNADALSALGESAGQVFHTLVSGLNSRVAGRSLFSGTGTDAAALNSAETILGALRIELSGAATAVEVEARLENWFASGGDFETVGYLGETQDLAPLRIGDATDVNLGLRADDQVFRDLLKSLAMAHLAVDDSLGFDADVQKSLISAAGDNMLAANSALTQVQSRLGAQEARIDETISRNESSAAALEMARTELMSVDPYEAATALEDAQLRLEGIYAVTARMSRLTLADYL